MAGHTSSVASILDAGPQAVGQLGQVLTVDPSGGELDGEGEPVELSAQLADRCDVGGGRSERGIGEASAIDEEVHRVVGALDFEFRVGSEQRADRQNLLARKRESLPTRGHDPDARA